MISKSGVLEALPLCLCGCRQEITKIGNRFVNGHNRPWLGKHHTDETKQKLSKICTGRRHSDETKRKLAEIHLGKCLSEETKRKMSIAHTGERNAFYGRHHTKETRRKLSVAATGRKHSEETRRKMSEANMGHEVSTETRRKISVANSGRRNGMYGRSEDRLGPNNPNWKGGNSFKPYGFEFNCKLKYGIRERDNFICQKCGLMEQEELEKLDHALSIHHIDYDKKNNDESNLITFCHSCNMKVNFNREYWQDFFFRGLRCGGTGRRPSRNG